MGSIPLFGTMNNYDKVQYDQYGEPYVIKDGKREVPDQSRIIKTSSNFTTFDTKYGHCGLCGSLYCNGRCFK